jgi:hypothetical protein
VSSLLNGLDRVGMKRRGSSGVVLFEMSNQTLQQWQNKQTPPPLKPRGWQEKTCSSAPLNRHPQLHRV